MGEAHAEPPLADTGRGWGRKEATGWEQRPGFPSSWLLCLAGNEGNEVKCHKSSLAQVIVLRTKKGGTFHPVAGPRAIALSSDLPTLLSPEAGSLLRGWGWRWRWGSCAVGPRLLEMLVWTLKFWKGWCRAEWRVLLDNQGDGLDPSTFACRLCGV